MRSIKIVVAFFVIFLSVFAITSCTNVGAIRTLAMPTSVIPKLKPQNLLALCAPGIGRGHTGGELLNSIEEYGTHMIGYVEYSDQGWEYNGGEQRQALIKRLREELNKPESADTAVVNVVFIHGWHHSAYDDDCNVNEFRAMIQQLNTDLQPPVDGRQDRMRLRFNGVYVSWRGESLTLPILRQATVFDRRNAAEHVAKGAARELFADLRHLELDDEETHANARHPRGRVRTLVIGHSFGGLIAFNALSPALINDLSLARPLDGTDSTPYSCSKAALARRFWPDMTILINPAFEASRFQALHDVATEAMTCKDEIPRPKMVVVTADNDIATGKIYPAFRAAASIFEQYDATSDVSEALERDANIHVVGFVKRFQTHRLALGKVNGQSCVIETEIFLKPENAPAIVALAKKALPSRSAAIALRDTQRHAVFVSNAARHVWVVGVPAEIVNGHDGFLYPNAKAGKYDPYLLHWLVTVYLRNSADNDVQNILNSPPYLLCPPTQQAKN